MHAELLSTHGLWHQLSTNRKPPCGVQWRGKCYSVQTAPSWHSEVVRGPWGEACHSQARLQLDCSALLYLGLVWVTTLLSVLLCSSLLLSALARGETPVAETQSSVLGGKGKCLHLCFRILLSIFTKILLEFFFLDTNIWLISLRPSDIYSSGFSLCRGHCRRGGVTSSCPSACHITSPLEEGSFQVTGHSMAEWG